MKPEALTKLFVDSIKTTIRKTFSDEKQTRGLHLRVTPRGAKSWWFVYRNTTGKQRWLLLGTYPATPLAEARKRALTQRLAVESGLDPVAQKRVEKAAAAQQSQPTETFGAFIETEFLPWAKKHKRTWLRDEQKLRNRILPLWGGRPLQSLTRKDVDAFLGMLEAEGLGAGCNRYQMLLSKVFTMAINRGHYTSAHPVARMDKRAPEAPRDRILSDAEIRALWDALNDPANATDRGHAIALQLLLLTGQRAGEVARMRRDDLDMLQAVWTIPGANAKNGKAHAVPLSPTAKAVIEKRLAALPSDQSRLFGSLTTQNLSSARWAGLRTGYVWHDLRRTVGSRLAKLGFDRTTRGSVLNHSKSGVTDTVYNHHDYADEKRAALDAWDRELARIIQGGESIAARVVSLARTA
jgi:integrase